jgi:hypothetical protein
LSPVHEGVDKNILKVSKKDTAVENIINDILRG